MSSPAARLVVIHGSAGADRRVADRLARAAGWRTRVASRPAELVKALDGAVHALWLLDGNGDDGTLASGRLATDVRITTRTPGETIEHFVSRALQD